MSFYPTTEGLFDALNQNWGPLVPIEGWLREYHEPSDLPLMATEFSFRSSEGDEPYDAFVEPVTVTNLRGPHLAE